MSPTLPQDWLCQEVSIHFEERNGWLRIFTDAEFHAHPLLGKYLAGMLTRWFRERPHYLMRSVLPIVWDSRTVEVYAWFDVHLSSAPSNGWTPPLPTA